MSRSNKLFCVAVVLICVLVAVACVSPARAVGHLEVVKAFEPPDELPEGITIDKPGNMYVSLGPPFFVGGDFGQVRKISPDGTETVLVDFPGGPAPAGLAVDPSGNLFFGVPSLDASVRGVYRVTDDGSAERLPGTHDIIVANGLALDKQGNLFVSDSVTGAIWRITPDGEEDAQVWKQPDELLAGCGEADPVGANGIAFWKGNLYVANTARGLLVEVPTLKDGSAGESEIVAGINDCDPAFDELDAMDGIALDVHGNVFAMLVIQNKVVRIDPTDGSVTTVLTEEDGLHNPASVAFGTGKGDRQSIYITNYAVLGSPSNSLGPAVLKLDVGVPGLPLP